MANIKQRAVVIGGAGFVGSHTVKELMLQGYPVLIMDNLSTGGKENIPQGAEFLEVDIRNYNDIVSALKETDIVFHIADSKNEANTLEATEINVRGTYNILEASRVKKVTGIIFASSSTVYGSHEGHALETTKTEPSSLYGTHKLMCENLAKTYTKLFAMPMVTLRYFNVYGYGQTNLSSEETVIAQFLQKKETGLPIPLSGKGLETKDFVHVNDVAKANVLAIDILNNKDYECFNICTGKNTTLKEVADLLGGDVIYTHNEAIPVHIFGDSIKAENILHFKAQISLEDGLSTLVHTKK